MKLRQCDRCGVTAPSGPPTMKWGWVQHSCPAVPGNQKAYRDICPRCLAALMKWMNTPPTPPLPETE